VDVVLFRLPQPVERPFISRIRKYFPKAKFINAPEGIIETSSKEYLLQVRDLCPTLSLCQSLSEAIALSHQYEIVLKPMYSYGGRGMFRLSTDAVWKEDERYPISHVHDIIQVVDFPMLSMRFLKNVVLGDKRTIVVHREVIGSALRLPAPGSWMCNIAHGGRAQLDEPDADEWRIESVLTPLLLKKGIVMYGFDTLVDDDGRRVLSEINTLSIGGLMPMEEMSKEPVLKKVAGLLIDYLEQRS
jgi:glutathione synthase